jgi:tetratricopeptide (TPR) repeat protein
MRSGIGFRAVGFAILSLAISDRPLKAQQATTVQIQALLKEGDDTFTRGDYDAARVSFEKGRQFAQQLPADSPIRYEVLKRLTSTSAASGQFADAARYLEQAIKWRESAIGPKDPKIADDLLLLVNLNLRTKEFDRALADAQRVQAMHIEAYTSGSIPVADDLLRIGQIYLAEEKAREAVRALSTAVGLRTRLVGSLDPGLLPILDNLIEAFQRVAGGISGGGNEPLYRSPYDTRDGLR